MSKTIKKFKDKYKIEDITVTKEFCREKRLIEDRGELVLLSDGEEIMHITYFSLNPGIGFYRGGHYHKRKIEKFYVVTGQILIHLKDIETLEAQIIEVNPGQRVTIRPMCAHKFEVVSPSQVIEYYSTPYDSKDDIRFDDF